MSGDQGIRLFSVECKTVGCETIGHVTIGCETIGCDTVRRETVGQKIVGRDHRTFFLAVILEWISFLLKKDVPRNFASLKKRYLTLFRY